MELPAAAHRGINTLVIDPDGVVVAATNPAQQGAAVAGLADMNPDWRVGLHGDGAVSAPAARTAQFFEDPTQHGMVLTLPFAWPTAAGDNAVAPRHGGLMLRLDLSPTMAGLRHAGMLERLLELGWIALAALVAMLALERLVVRPLRTLQRAAVAVGGGQRGVHMPPMRPAELQGVGESFNSLSRNLAELMQRLCDSERRLRDLFASAPDAMLTVTPDGVIESFNAAAERLFGYPMAAMLGQPLA